MSLTTSELDSGSHSKLIVVREARGRGSRSWREDSLTSISFNQIPHVKTNQGQGVLNLIKSGYIIGIKCLFLSERMEIFYIEC